MQIVSVILISLAIISIVIMCVLLFHSIRKAKDRKKNKKMLLETYSHIKIAIVTACVFIYAGNVLGEYENYVNSGITNIMVILYSTFLRDFISVFIPGIAIFCVVAYLYKKTKNTEE